MAAISLRRPALPLASMRIVWIVVAVVGLLAAGAGFLAGRHMGDAHPSSNAAPAAGGAWKGMPAGLHEKFVRGVSLSFWFTHRDQPELRAAVPDAADLSMIRKMGLRHVRVMFDPAWLAAGDAFSRVDDARLAELVAAVHTVNDAGLMMVLALQPKSDVKPRLATDDAVLAKAIAMWKAVATALARVPDESLVLEVLNEPEIEDADRALAIQRTFVDAIREVSPGRVVVVAGAHYSDIDDLVRVAPLDVARVVYAFHFYEPHNFTHQGATWGWPMWQQLHDLPYPSSPEDVQPILETTSAAAREHAAYYGQQRWTKDKLAEIVDKGAQWGRTHDVPLWCSEFGVLRDVTPPISRQAWLADVRDLFESRGIAWTHFDWWDHFGLVTGAPGQRKVDTIAVEGLGLDKP